ncbi:MAG: hypothetical protein A3J93_04130 [Candidatus Magasanikbacteria bacterium RIFOXYC2_FULL_42_28]|uniref:Uncharacterized protein n=1 Tax=Candidatus Magasanikbacteria bacterium RIFOXYC2_FULL_42_28 TaxID=1798704 RepID=A0A1F6NWX4_9BACT|nr:MAG: hypothetical protein A3J93_04130 [Candidatus Magasanikbacteria bacterium RIFOXYC2_FULL_42_28]
MLAKPLEKELAIKLRKQGLSYSEILKSVSVSQASLSLWLRDVNLDDEAKKRLIRISREGILRGAKIKKDARISVEKNIREDAAKDIDKLSNQTLLLMGAALYWAEGSKQKTHNVSAKVIFSNSDDKMIKFFYQWLVKICKIPLEDLHFEIYVHKNGPVVSEQKRYWSNVLGIGLQYFDKVYFKKGNINSYRRNKGIDYHGVLRIKVRRSTNLNRKIMGWVFAAHEQFINYSEVV